jgi:quercetin dioxygenase-like cupin family protein
MESQFTYFENIKDGIQDIPSDSIISRTIHQDERLKVVLFGFAPGQELSEHTAAVPAVIHILEGEAQLTLDELSKSAHSGSWTWIPANLPHSVFAQTKVIMLLLLLKY